MSTLTPADFIARWKNSGGAEIANSQSFLKELCDLIGVPHPEPRAKGKKKEKKAAPKAAKSEWPGSLPERFQAIRQALTAFGKPATSDEIATGFSRAKKDQVAEILETLVTVGQARQTRGGKFVA